jgi:hypothetical protein
MDTSVELRSSFIFQVVDSLGFGSSASNFLNSCFTDGALERRHFKHEFEDLKQSLNRVENEVFISHIETWDLFGNSVLVIPMPERHIGDFLVDPVIPKLREIDMILLFWNQIVGHCLSKVSA